MKTNVVITEYDAMIKALANKFGVDQDSVESIPEVSKIKERCCEMDEHISFLIKSGAVENESSAEKTLANLEKAIKNMYSDDYIVSEVHYEPKLKLLEYIYGTGGVFKKVAIKDSTLTDGWALISIKLVTLGVEPLLDKETELANKVVYLLNKGNVIL